MDMSKLRAGELVLPNEPFALGPLVHEVAEAMRAAHPLVAITVACAVPAGAHMFKGSRLHLSQVLKNLAGNACKFVQRKFAGGSAGGPQGMVHIAVAPVEFSFGGGLEDMTTFRFVVQDNGPGIPREAQRNIFLTYQQAGLQPGTGLGLPIASALVELMGGAIDVTSPYDEHRSGARFSFAVSFGNCSVNSSDPGSSRSSSSEGPTDETAALLASTGRVMIADDDEMNRLVMRMYLKKLIPAWDVSEAATADEAVGAIKAAHDSAGPRFDVVLMDEDFGFDMATRIAHKSGTAATKEIREFLGQRAAEAAATDAPPMRRMLIVGATGYESKAHRVRALKAGQDDVLGKPYEEEELKRVLLVWFRRRPTAVASPAQGNGTH